MKTQYDQVEAPGLCKWVRDQRKDLLKERKSEAIAQVGKKKADLDSLGFVWHNVESS